MEFLLILIATVVVAGLLHGPIHRYPGVFYGLAIAVDVLYIYLRTVSVPFWLWRGFLDLLQQCLLPLALFVLVMYIGCFARDSKMSRWFRPIRSELSVIACLLCAGHVVAYLGPTLAQVMSTNGRVNVIVSFVVSMVLLVLLIVLGVTSFNFVKRRMTKRTWTRIQRWAYVFFGLIYIHLMFMLFPSAVHGGIAARVSVTVYSIIFGGYAIWRIVRAVMDGKEEGAGAVSAGAVSAGAVSSDVWDVELVGKA